MYLKKYYSLCQELSRGIGCSCNLEVKPIRYLRYKHFSKLPPDFLKKKATEVLYEKMVFYDNKAKQLYQEVRKVLKEDKSAVRGDLMAQMIKHMQKANDICIECAAKLAPYQSARLQSMEVKKNVTHRFVIQAPKQAESSQEWLAQADQAPKLIESKAHTLNGVEYNDQ